MPLKLLLFTFMRNSSAHVENAFYLLFYLMYSLPFYNLPKWCKYINDITIAIYPIFDLND